MRTIKFRAWIKQRNEMTYDSTDDQDSILVDSLNAINGSLESDRYDFMQFTGLLDKNGKEIYEGDIVKYFDYKYDVKFHAGMFGIIFKDDFDPISHFYLDSNLVKLNLEVIGNIYENKNLLEREDG